MLTGVAVQVGVSGKGVFGVLVGVRRRCVGVDVAAIMFSVNWHWQNNSCVQRRSRAHSVVRRLGVGTHKLQCSGERVCQAFEIIVRNIELLRRTQIMIEAECLSSGRIVTVWLVKETLDELDLYTDIILSIGKWGTLMAGQSLGSGSLSH